VRAVTPIRAVTPVPASTYRLQFTPSFGFTAATAIVPYLDELGIGWMYASPYLRARPGSEHGYDVVDPTKLNPEIGTPQEHATMVAALRERGMGHLIDFVPNHMGIGSGENPRWQDVLEWGEQSEYRDFFDIDWKPLRPDMRGKVLVPFLGDYYGRVLERGELSLVFDAPSGSFSVAYFDKQYPLAPETYGELLALAATRHAGHAWALRALAGEFPLADHAGAMRLKTELTEAARDAENVAAIDAALADYRKEGGDDGAIDRLDAVLSRQHYRLAYWRVSADEINYRRFFDINDLVGVRVEDASVFAQTHEFVFSLIERGLVQGLRIDHVDGLANPTDYCTLLQDRAAALGHPQYLVVEKILARFEHLRTEWRIAGTTGYDFMNQVSGLFIDGHAEATFDLLYREFAGIGTSFDQFAYRAKKDIVRTALASELEVLTAALDRIATMDRSSNDFTYNVLRDALTETVASFPVYRTYVTGEPVDDDDRRFIAWAIRSARRRSDLGDESVFSFLESVLLLDASQQNANYDRRSVLQFAMKFQQYTSPVMAKAVEDTAFYRYIRLISINEVGGDPRVFGTSVETFHEANAERARLLPHAMLATATHDHKRGEDTRTRIDALSEMPGLWDKTIRGWREMNLTSKSRLDGGLIAPTDNDEYLLYQTLIGTWPAEWLGDDAVATPAQHETYVARIEQYLEKALREAKFRTSWTNPDEAYETAAKRFAREILRPGSPGPFSDELRRFARECATVGALSSLAQTTLKLTSPGIPDIYQGTEYWDLSLVDPDNRRPVDYAERRRAIEGFAEYADRGEAGRLAAELLDRWHDGRVKAYVTWSLLRLRRERPATFLGTTYAPLATRGTAAERLVAFAREGLVVVVPRLVRRDLVRDGDIARAQLRYTNERVLLRAEDGTHFIERLTGRTFHARRDENETYLAVEELLGPFPVAVLVPVR